MITYIAGNLFDSPAQVLVNAVNTVGVMGKGIAKDFKQIYPEMFKQYQALCETGQFQVGQLWLYKSPNKWVLNFPTKRHWREPSKVEYIEKGLQKFVDAYAQYGIHSVAFPTIGCGNGELDFDSQIHPLLDRYLSHLPIDVFVYLYEGDQFVEHRAPKRFKEWLRSEPASLAFSEVWDDIERLLETQTEFETVAEKSKFTAELVTEPEEGVRFESGAGRPRFVSKDVFLEIWQQIRTYGYSKRGMSPIYRSDMMFIIGLFASDRLPYVRPVKIADTYNRWAIGLQYEPIEISHGKMPTQLTLF